jgi:MarR family transcriptional regulator, lower aerobic nicotinate degradation pathway regulator
VRTLYGKKPSFPGRFASEMGLTRGAVTTLADRLIAKALIIRKANANDGCPQTLHLTSRGAALAPELAALADENESERFVRLSTHHRRTLPRILDEIVVRLGLTKTPLD